MKSRIYMRKLLIPFFFIGLQLFSLQAEEFYLKEDATGKKYGPFTSESGAKVELGEASFTLEKELSEAEINLSIMVIKEIDMRNAPLEDFIRYLVHQTRDLDPKGVGVNSDILTKPPAM